MRRRGRPHRTVAVVLAVAVGAGGAGCAPAGGGCADRVQGTAGYRALFDGTASSFDAWEHAGEGGFVHTDDCTVVSSGGMGLAYLDEELTAPYTLRVEWRVVGEGNSGVFVGFPAPGDDPWVAVTAGEEVQITTREDPGGGTGAIYEEQDADAAAVERALAQPGAWNTFDIDVTADGIVVWLNGVRVTEHRDADPGVDLATGRVGIQNHGPDDEVAFARVEVGEGRTVDR